MMHHGQAKIDIDHVLKTTTDKNILLSKSIRYLSNFKPSDPSDFNPSDSEESEESYLQKLRLSDVQRYFDVSEQIMEKLDATFQGSNDSYLPWLKYFTASNQVKVTAGYTDETLDKFIEGISELTTRLLLKDGKQKTVDWRIAKQILVMKRLFDPRIVDTIQPQQLVEAVLKEVDKALEELVWPGHNHIPTIEFTKRALANLKQEIVASKDDKKVLNAIISGRFDKADFSTLGHTLILGEDGGLFLLLNAVNLEEKKILDNAVSSDYLLDKVSGTKKTDLRQQIVIGKGGFGKVRFAVSLFIAKTTKPSDIICIKKTGSFAKLNAEMRAKQDIRHTAAEQVIEATFGDYFTGDIAKVVYSPAIVDMAIVMSKDYIKKPVHQKGYLMMEILPQNTGNKIFQDPQYQKWEYQKPYLIDVFEGVNELLARKVAMTDLKPENTLYDKDTRQATIIDLGGAVEVADLATFDTRTTFQSTPGYQAPELLEEGIIDIRKALAYSCGNILQKITDSEGFTTDCNKNDIKQLINKLTENDPGKRLSINEALTEIRNMGDDSYKQQAVFSHYISKLKEKLTQNKASLSINDNIDETRKLYLDQEVTELDSYKYKKLKRKNLMAKIEIFFQREAPATKEVKEPEPEQEEQEEKEKQGENAEENAEEKEEEEEEEEQEQDDEEKLSKLRAKQVFLLLGAAGSGKSIALQLKFIEAVNRWQSGRALPVYFNLANEVDLIKILTSMNQLLGTKITLKELHDQPVDLYVDSFDEGIGETRLKERDTLINNYIKQISAPQGVQEEGLGGNEESRRRRKIKVLVSCRSDYLQNDRDDAWFAPKAATEKISSSEVVEQPQMNLLEKWYIAPISYKTSKELKTNIRKYLNYLNTQTHASAEEVNAADVKYDAQWYQNQIKRADLKTSIDTGFMFYIVMETLPSLHSHTITKQDIYRTYINLAIKRALKMSPWTPEQLQQIKHTFTNYDYQHFFDQLGRYIAGQLHTSKQFRFDQTSMLLLQGFGYRKDVPFRQQMAFYLLRVLPLKIEIKLQEPVVEVPGMHSASRDQGDVSSIRYEEITIGFTNDILKNYYLVQAIEHELDKTRKSPLLASRDIVKDKLLMSHLFEAVEQGPQAQMWQQTLLQAVLHTKSEKSADAITCAANAITLLNLLQNVLPAQDLSNTSIRGANLRNGWLQYTDFNGADLSNVNLSNAHLTYANLAKANLSGVNLGISPDLAPGLIRNIHMLWKLDYSPDGKHLATYSATHRHDDPTVTIWDQATNKKLNTVTGQLLTFSPNGKTIATASPKDKTLTIWDVATAKKLNTFNSSRSLSYSPNNQTLAVLSIARDMVQVFTADYKLLVTLKCDDLTTTTLSYSPDGKTIVTGSNVVIKVWDVATGNLLDTITGDASRELAYSPDGKNLVTYSSSYQLKLWNVATRKVILKTNSIGFKYSPDGKVIANCFDNQLELWDMTADKPLATKLAGHSSKVKHLSFSPDSKALVTAADDYSIKIWDIVTGKQLGANLAGHTFPVECLSYSSDGKTVLAGFMDNTVKIWSTSSSLDHLEATRNGHTEMVEIVSYSPDGTTIATTGSDCKLKFWHSATSRQQRTDWNLSKVYGGHSFRFCYSPDSRFITTGNKEDLSIWDAVTGKLVGKHKLPFDCRFRTMSCSPDSKILAIGLENGNVILWDAVTQKQIKKDLQGHTGFVSSVSFSPDGKILASGAEDKMVRLWDVANHTQVGNPLEGHTEFVNSVRFSPDGKIIASGSADMTIRFWDVAKHTQIGKQLEGHTGAVNSISFSGDGRLLASGSHDDTVRVWDVTKQTQIGNPLKAHTNTIKTVCFSRDGRNIVSGSNDHSVKIWGEKNGKWVVIHDLHAVESPLLADDMIIEGAILSEQNKQVFEQRKCKEGQNTILPAMIHEEQKDTLHMTEFTRKLETELIAKFKHQNGQTSSDLTGNNNNQRSQSTNLINLQISALNQPAKKTQREQPKSELNAKSKQQDSQPPSGPISNNNNQRSQSNNLSTLQSTPNRPENNTQSEQPKSEIFAEPKQPSNKRLSNLISNNNNEQLQSNNLNTLQSVPNQPENNTQSEQPKSEIFAESKQQDSQPPSGPISNNNNEQLQSNNLNTLQSVPNQPENNTQSEQPKSEIFAESKQQDSQPPSGPISNNDNQRSQSNNLSTLQYAPNQPENNTQSEQARISGLYSNDKQQSLVDHNITSPPFGTGPHNTQVSPLYPAEQKLEPDVVKPENRSSCCEIF